MSQGLAEIRRLQLFDGLDDDAVQDLLSEAQKRAVCKDAMIFFEGRPAGAVHVLTAGFAKMIQTTPNGARVILRYVGPGEPFGTPALLKDGRYPADAVAVTNAVEIQWPARVLCEILRKHPNIASNAIRILEGRLREMESRLRELSNEPVEQRIAQAVVRLVRKLGRQVGDLVEVPFPLTRQDIADMTGTTLHTVSRTLGAWERRGLIERGRQRVAVADLARLAALVEARNAGEASPRRTHRRGMPRR